MSSLIYRDIELKRQKGAQQFEGCVERFLVKQMRLNGNLKVPGRPGYVYVQQVPEDDAPPPVPVLCLSVQPREGLMGWVERNRDGLWEFVDWSRAIVNLPDYSGQTYLPPHHLDHEWPDQKPGPDAVNVYPRAHVPLRAEAGVGGGLTVDVAPLRYPVGATFVFFPGLLGLDLSASQPAVGLARYVGIYLDPTSNIIGTVNGTTVVDAAPITPPDPSFPRGCIPSAVVRLDGSQTTFTEPDFSDRRSSLRGDGWKFSGNVLVVGPQGDYATVALAIAAAMAGDLIWVDAGTYDCDNQTLIAGVLLMGMGPDMTTLRSTTQTITLNMATGSFLADVKLTNSVADGTALYTNGFIYGRNVIANVTGANNPAAVTVAGGIARFFNCDFSGKRAMALDTATVYLFASIVEGQAVVGTDIYDLVGAGSNVYNRAVPTIGHATSGVRISSTIAVHGTFVDPNGQLYSRTDGLIQLDERAGAPANPPTNNWDQWFESDGLHILDDTGAEYIFPGGIDPAGHTHSKLVASDGAPDPAQSNDATGILTSVDDIKVPIGKDFGIGSFGVIENWLSGWPAETPDDHFTTAALSAYWGAWTITPATLVDPDFREHWLKATASAAQQNTLCMLQTASAYTGFLGAQIATDNNEIDVGVRFDNGSDNTFLEAYIKAVAGGAFSAKLYYRYQDAGGGITETAPGDPFPPGFPVTLYIARYSTVLCQVLAGFEANYVTNVNFTNFTPTRSGLFVRNLTNTGARNGYFNWFRGRS